MDTSTSQTDIILKLKYAINGFNMILDAVTARWNPVMLYGEIWELYDPDMLTDMQALMIYKDSSLGWKPWPENRMPAIISDIFELSRKPVDELLLPSEITGKYFFTRDLIDHEQVIFSIYHTPTITFTRIMIKRILDFLSMASVYQNQFNNMRLHPINEEKKNCCCETIRNALKLLCSPDRPLSRIDRLIGEVVKFREV